MTSPIEKQNPHLMAAAAVTRPAPCELLRPAGMDCLLTAGHPPPCTPVTEPPASDPSVGSAPAASVVEDGGEREPAADNSAAARQYGFAKRKEQDVELPSGGFIRVRQLTTTQVIKLKIVNMRDAFGTELLAGINGAADAEAAWAEAESKVWVDPERSDKLMGVLDRVAAEAVTCPRVVLSGPSNDDQINANDIELVDKWVIFEAAMPDQLKLAAQEAQQQALKSLRGGQTASA